TGSCAQPVRRHDGARQTTNRDTPESHTRTRRSGNDAGSLECRRERPRSYCSGTALCGLTSSRGFFKNGRGCHPHKLVGSTKSMPGSHDGGARAYIEPANEPPHFRSLLVTQPKGPPLSYWYMCGLPFPLG